MLSDSESEAEGHQLTVNEHFAKAYARKKEREELTKRAPPNSLLTLPPPAVLTTSYFLLLLLVKEKYGSDAEEDDESDSEDESEDEDGEELTPAVDAAILRTLARIKKKDPDIYDAEKGIFEGGWSSFGIHWRRLCSRCEDRGAAKDTDEGVFVTCAEGQGKLLMMLRLCDVWINRPLCVYRPNRCSCDSTP